jgi:hypothetical protein
MLLQAPRLVRLRLHPADQAHDHTMV